MKRLQSRYVTALPTRRPLKIFSSDPMSGRNVGNRISIDIANEPLQPGPQGLRVEVIDYDATNNRFYPAVDLNDVGILMQGGLEPTESDPRFHQQMVYAVAMKTLENFDRALGRRIELRRGKFTKLRIIPHAFHAANAFYDRDLHAILFGYFRADRDDPGANFPGQNVFTCLSHDIIVHEMTHALVDRQRRYFMEPSNEDVLAFHEGFSDIVALLQHFSFQELLRDSIQSNRGDLRTPNDLVDLARQFGYATGAGKALRSAIGKVVDPGQYRTITEPHERGSILVAAVFDAFFTTYQRRIRDLIRIASGGTGKLPDGDLHPDLVNRIAGEASRSAQQILTMCIRAFDYLPPVDITFGDYLRALVTADYELNPTDEFGQRNALITAFRVRGIYPANVTSPAEESLLWDTVDSNFPRLPLQTMDMLVDLLNLAAAASRSTNRWSEKESESYNIAQAAQYSISDEGTDRDISETMAGALHAFAQAEAAALNLDPQRKIEVHGFHPGFRVAPDGRLLIELIVQFAQQDDTYQNDALGGIPLRGGTTLVASADGTVRYLIAKPLPSSLQSTEQQSESQKRYERQVDYVRLCDSVDANCAYYSQKEYGQRMKARINLSALHQGALT